MNQIDSFHGIPIKTNILIPKDKVVLTDIHANPIGVIDLETPRTKLMRLLNMGPE